MYKTGIVRKSSEKANFHLLMFTLEIRR